MYMGLDVCINFMKDGVDLSCPTGGHRHYVAYRGIN